MRTILCVLLLSLTACSHAKKESIATPPSPERDGIHFEVGGRNVPQLPPSEWQEIKSLLANRADYFPTLVMRVSENSLFVTLTLKTDRHKGYWANFAKRNSRWHETEGWETTIFICD